MTSMQERMFSVKNDLHTISLESDYFICDMVSQLCQNFPASKISSRSNRSFIFGNEIIIDFKNQVFNKDVYNPCIFIKFSGKSDEKQWVYKFLENKLYNLSQDEKPVHFDSKCNLIDFICQEIIKLE